MTLAKVPGTKIRGTTYHLNIPIPKTVQHLHPDHKGGIMRGTLRTSDPREAERQVREQRTILDRQVKEDRRLKDRDKLIAALGPEDRALVDDLGGIRDVLEVLRHYRSRAAFTLAGQGGELDFIEATEEAPPHVMRDARAEEEVETQARLTYLSGQARPLKRIAKAVGENIEEPPAGFDEGVTGVREAAERLADAKGYTVQLRESLNYTARRWIEAHGDIPLEKWTRAHLAQFDDLLTGLPSGTSKDVRALPIRDAVKRAKRDDLPTIGYKTRKRFIEHMKAIVKVALDRGYMQADPFSGFTPRSEKQKYSTKKEAKTLPYTREEAGKMIDFCAANYSPDVIDHWLPILAAYTGARREELGQLMVGNVRLSGNIHVLDVTDLDENQKVKNQHSLRVVPIPSVVINMGFLEYVDRRRQAGGTMLFLEDFTAKDKTTIRREMVPNPRGRYTEVYGMRFGRKVLEPLGLKVPGKKFHSLRHSWTDAARRAGIDSEIRRLIAGRLDKEDPTEAGYGGDDFIAEKLEALDLVAKYVRD